MAMMPYGRNIKIPIVPHATAQIVFDGTTQPTTITQYEEVYQDYNTNTVRTVGQDREIARLKKELEEKEKVKKQKVGDLIAYYYKR